MESLVRFGSPCLQRWLPRVFRVKSATPLAVVVCGTAPTAADVAAPLRAPGLLDCMLTLRAPAAEDRAALLASALQAKAALFDPAALQARSISPPTEVSLQSLLQRCNPR